MVIYVTLVCTHKHDLSLLPRIYRILSLVVYLALYVSQRNHSVLCFSFHTVYMYKYTKYKPFTCAENDKMFSACESTQSTFLNRD